MEGTLTDRAALPERRTLFASLRRTLRGPRLLLMAVGLVVVLVSLPLLRTLALKENELDAMRVLDLLGREVLAAEAAPLSLGYALQEDKSLSRRLPDSHLLADGRLVLRHGYLFELVQSVEGGQALRAWPAAHGETGLAAFWSSAPGRLLGHPNRAATWSGIASPPEPIERDGQWRLLSLSPTRNEGL